MSAGGVGWAITPFMEQGIFGARMQAERTRRGMSVSAVARLAGIKRDIVRDLERREGSSTTVERALAIARALGVTIEDLLCDDLLPLQIMIEMGGRAYRKSTVFGSAQRPPWIGADPVEAALVMGEDLSPFAHQGSVIFFRAGVERVPGDAIGRACMVEAADGERAIMHVRPGTRPGLHHALSLARDGVDHRDLRMMRASPVRLILPLEIARIVDLEKAVAMEIGWRHGNDEVRRVREGHLDPSGRMPGVRRTARKGDAA